MPCIRPCSFFFQLYLLCPFLSPCCYSCLFLLLFSFSTSASILPFLPVFFLSLGALTEEKLGEENGGIEKGKWKWIVTAHKEKYGGETEIDGIVEGVMMKMAIGEVFKKRGEYIKEVKLT